MKKVRKNKKKRMQKKRNEKGIYTEKKRDKR
jgi:hypothetical protein